MAYKWKDHVELPGIFLKKQWACTLCLFLILLPSFLLGTHIMTGILAILCGHGDAGYVIGMVKHGLKGVSASRTS